ncbi:MAG: proline--tRNA ligase, partial [Anaerovoracaceae bacterium]
HEEIFTDIIRNSVSSYRQLPQMLYQIQAKYRDEARPRFGLIRSREFIMKDCYSFDRDPEGLDKSYKAMYDAYAKIFRRCGLDARPVEADNGAIGGSNSHEFTALSEVGESEIAYCDKCKYAATTERAATVDASPQDEVKMKPLEMVNTPGTKTIEAVCEYLDLDPIQTIKALLFVKYDEEGNEDGYVAAFVRGDRDCNMTKLVNALGIAEHQIAFADEKEMGEATGCVGGFTGPCGLHDCTIVVDSELPGLKNLCAGACREDYHYINVNYGRDYKADIIADIKVLKEGDPCPECGAPIKHTRGIEVGQVFKLGTKYSVPMHAVYADENQDEHPIWMGCYGIGISRTLAAVVEQHHDDDGIIWPVSVAPYHVEIVVMKTNDETQNELAEKMYNELTEAGLEVIMDDRNERPGVKFKDADLIGIPVRITVGRLAKDGQVEYKLRRDKDKTVMTAEDAVKAAVELVNTERRG